MARRTRTSRTRGGRTRTSSRKLIWARGIAQNTDIAANSSVFSNLTATFETAYGAELIGCTVMRMRFKFFTPPANAGLPIIYGVRVMTTSQFDNLDNPSGPGTDLHADWATWGMMNTGADGAIEEVDVKAMRKFEELGQGLVLGVSNLDGATAVSDIDFAWSLLIALP